jgi:hypothetical protein
MRSRPKRYAEVDPADVIRTTGVTVPGSPLPSAQPIYVCVREHETRVQHGLDAAGVKVPLLSIFRTDVRLVGHPLADPEAAAALTAPIPVEDPPPAIIKIDVDSPLEEFEELAAQELVAAMALGQENVSVPAVADGAMQHFAIYPAGIRDRIVRKFEHASSRVAQRDPEHFEYRQRTSTRHHGVVQIRNSPEQSDPRGRTQGYQAAANRLSGRPAPVTTGAEELSLFDEVDLAEELGRAADDTSESD